MYIFVSIHIVIYIYIHIYTDLYACILIHLCIHVHESLTHKRPFALSSSPSPLTRVHTSLLYVYM